MFRTPALRKLLQLFQQAHQANRQSHPNVEGLGLSIIGEISDIGTTSEFSGSAEMRKARGSGSRSLRRRQFIQLATLSGGAAVAMGTLGQAPVALSNAGDRKAAPRVAIVGGGIAGLNAAYQLKKAGIRATVYEARSRIGGRIYSVTGQLGTGLVSDIGGSLINTTHADMLALVQDFNLQLFNRKTDPAIGGTPETGYYFEGRTRYEAELAQKLRPLAQVIARDVALLDEDYETYGPRFDQFSVKAYLDNAASLIPEPWIRTLIENSILTEYGVEPQQSSCLQLLSLMATVDGNAVDITSGSDETYSVQGGSGLITDRLGQAIAGQVQTQMTLQRLVFNGKTYLLTFQNNQTIEADHVIMALPFSVLRNIDLRVNLPAGFRKMIQEVDLGKNEKIFVAFNQKLWRQPFGFIGALWSDLGFAEVWDDTQRQIRNDGALCFFFGGKQISAMQSGSAASQGKRMIDLLNRIIPNVIFVATQKFLRTNWSNDPFTKGSYTTFKPGQLTEFAEFFYIDSEEPQERQEVRFGNLRFAGEQLSDSYYGYMNGGAETGRLAAESLLRQLGRRKER